MKKKILVVDDHPIIYQGLKQMIVEDSKTRILGNAQNYEEALRLIRKLQPTLVIVDIGLKSEKNGLELVKDIGEKWPKIITMVLSMHDEEVYAERAFLAGARGYISKSDFTDKIIDAIDAVSSGNLYFTEDISESGALLHNKSNTKLRKLTDRELDVFRMIGQGLKNMEIAKKLKLKEKTILAHRLRIKNKLSLDSSNDLIHEAVKWYTENPE